MVKLDMTDDDTLAANPSQEESQLAQLFATLQQPPEPLAGPPPISKGERLAMALAGTLDPEFRKSFVEPRLAEEREMPARAQMFRMQQEAAQRSQQAGLLKALEDVRAAKAAEGLKREQEARLKAAQQSTAELNKARGDYYRAIAKRGPGGKSNPMFAALDKQISALQKYHDQLDDPYIRMGEDVPEPVRQKKAQVQKQIEGLLKRQEDVLRKVLPDLVETEDPFADTEQPVEDFFGEAAPEGGI